MAGTNLGAPQNSSVNIETTDQNGYALTGYCVGAPSGVATEANVYQVGCIMQQTDAATGAVANWENTGTLASVTWTKIGTSSPGSLALTNTHIMVGNASNVAADVALSGDASMANTGAITVTGATAAFNVGTNQTFAKEVNHTVAVTTTTTAATVGGNLAIAAGQGATSGVGGTLTESGGAGGLTGAGGNAIVAGGAGGATSGNAGSVDLHAGAVTSGLAGVVYTRSPLTKKQSVTAMTTSATITTTGILGGIITANQGGGAGATYTMPTGAVLAAALPSDFTTADSIDFTIVNVSTNASEIVTVATAASGTTMFGNLTVAANNSTTTISSATFRILCTGASTYGIYRIS